MTKLEKHLFFYITESMHKLNDYKEKLIDSSLYHFNESITTENSNDKYLIDFNESLSEFKEKISESMFNLIENEEMEKTATAYMDYSMELDYAIKITQPDANLFDVMNLTKFEDGKFVEVKNVKDLMISTYARMINDIDKVERKKDNAIFREGIENINMEDFRLELCEAINFSMNNLEILKAVLVPTNY